MDMPGKLSYKNYGKKYVDMLNNKDKNFTDGVISNGVISEPIFDPTLPYTLEIKNCEKIVLKDSTLDFVFEIPRDKIESFDEIVINGVKFVKV